ncbi:hypothetical protein KA013_03320 [Patescibacteria group bacterium]|nr:hypothetical protein [Patescibacteria group bacterium]
MQQIEETYEEQYEKLKESRKYVPSLTAILRNMQLSDTVRSTEAAFIVMKSFIDIEGVRNVYMSNQRVEDRKKLIVEIHNISVANNLKPFDLAKKENIHFVKE